MRHLIEISHMRRRAVTTFAWVTVCLLIPLIILSLIVVVLRLGNFAVLGVDTIFIVPDDPSFSITDTDGTWGTNNNIELFSISEKNGMGEVTVLSGEGDSIIAPGSTGLYRFELKNPGNVALDCDCLVGASFRFSGNTENKEFPFSIRLRDNNGNYLLGSETEWLPYHQLTDDEHEITLGKNSYVAYELEWRWDFEGGDDDLDTYFGTSALNKDLILTLSIATNAQLAADPDAVGSGNVLDPTVEPVTGGNLDTTAFALLITAIVAIITVMIIAYISYRQKVKRIGSLYRLSLGRRRR